MSNQVMPLVALAVSIVALALSLVATVAQRRRANMEIARALHIDLTSGVVADARKPLGELAFAVRSEWEADRVSPDLEKALRESSAEAADLRHHYFILLWCFERVWNGYKVIWADRRVVGVRPSREFADMLGWHVRNWSQDLPAIKMALETQLGEIHDGDSARAFAALGDAVLTNADIRKVRRRLGEMGLDPIGEPAWSAG
ncbi:hypothetical protein J7E96_10390 [Streptomyces sp. ISL-96]|uniref:hypothetical protein n=1 Tax=Streptomyces sp. ISL-96 TaxID=2819191 RepID=UPI001BE84124|nr:hypothetical protein [Streptomyces sp. ISL-96]MBT2488925.1 hypothetical protein [Streptomyces sp. ISL-96]